MPNNSDSTDIWAWVRRDEERLSKQGERHKAIVVSYNDFWYNIDTDPIAAELAISQAIEAAIETGEVQWELHLRHWRLQLWLRQRQVKRALPEAVDLLSLATDRRVLAVPQRICAFHDIVDCYAHLDLAGYYEEIVANSQNILSQLPKNHPCATCARTHLAQTSAAAGKAQEAEHWLKLTQATLTQPIHSGLVLEFGAISTEIGKWDNAERYYLQVYDKSQLRVSQAEHIKAKLSLVRVYLEKQNIQKALEMLQSARRDIKFESQPAILAQLAESDGRFASAVQQPQLAIEHLTRAARLYLDLGCYRDAAQAALYAAEVARSASIELPEEALTLAAQATGELPAASQSIHQKLASFGRQPIPPTTEAPENAVSSVQEQEQKELHTLQELLQEHTKQKHSLDVCLTLYQLANWHYRHNQIRSVLNYLLAGAALERGLKLPFHERRQTIGTLQDLRQNLPAGTLDSALAAAQSGPPSYILSLFPETSLAYWRWIMCGVEAEMADRPFIEPEPVRQDGEASFHAWLNHSASMTALILRFYDRCEPQEFTAWVDAMNNAADELAQHLNAAQVEDDPLLRLTRGFAALASGTPVAEVIATVPPPFTDIISQVAAIALTPVWQHPEASPLDFLVEQAAQKAVRALRHHDQARPDRLKNLALRYKLMTIDLLEQEPLIPIAHFLEALRALVLLEGKELPTLEQPLEEPFDGILKAIFEAGQLPETEEQ